ncbi:hypothetical protein Tco_1347929 [Tanacetum coccineum]
MTSTSTHQQSLADAGCETRPYMLKRGSYIPRSSRFLRYVDQNSKTRKFLRHSIDKGDDLKQYEADNEAMNLIFISIPNDIYNSIDACQNARDIWNIVKRLMQGTELSETEREPRFVNEFDKFTAELRESLSSVYNRFSQLTNDMDRNKVKPFNAIINTKFLNCLQPEWYKYVTNVHLAKNIKIDTYDILFDHLQHSSSSRSPTAYYVTHPPSVVDYDDDHQGDAVYDDQENSLTTTMIIIAHAITQRYSTPTNNLFCTSSNTRNQAVMQADRVDIQRRNVGNGGRYARRSSGTQRESAKSGNVQKETENGNNDFLLADAFKIKELEELSVNICMIARIQKADSDYKDGPSYDSAFISEVNDGKVEHDKNAHYQQDNAMEQLARNTFEETEKQQINAKKVNQQNVELTNELEKYKEMVWVFQNTNGNKTNFQNEYIEADKQQKS